MRYGLTLPTMGEGGDPRTVAELAWEAEHAGWDGVFVWDCVYIEAEETYDPWVTLAAIAMRTERVRLGTLLTPVARRRPWKLARETVTLDHMSNGRLILIVGTGLAGDGAFARVNEERDPRVRAQRLDEGLDVLTGLWSGRPFSYHGEHYHVEEMTFLPTPLQSPRIPIWYGTWSGWTPAVLRRTARLDGISIGGEEPDKIRDLRKAVESRRTAATPFDIAMEGETPGDDRAKAAEMLRPLAEAGVTWWVETVPGCPREREGVEGMRARIRQGPPRIDYSNCQIG